MKIYKLRLKLMNKINLLLDKVDPEVTGKGFFTVVLTYILATVEPDYCVDCCQFGRCQCKEKDKK